MTQWAFPFADNNGDRAYSDSDFSKFFSALFNTGVFMNVGTALQITQSVTPNMRVNIGKGAAIINGRIYFNNDTTALNIPVASSIQDRTDSVSVQLDLSKRTIEIVYKQSDTSVTRNDVIYELQIATIFVAKNATSITSSNITDKRGISTVCGYASPFQSVPVDGLVNQFSDMLNQFMNSSKQQFSDWFSSIKGKLGDAPATNLQTQIDAIKSTYADVTKDNIFQKNSTFNGSATVSGTFQTKSDTNLSNTSISGYFISSGVANFSTDVQIGERLTTNNATVKNGLTVNGGAGFNDKTYFNAPTYTGENIRSRAQVRTINIGSLKATVSRSGNHVTLSIMPQDWPYGSGSPWTIAYDMNIPAGYRPIGNSIVTAINKWATAPIIVYENGSMFFTSAYVDNSTQFEAYGSWNTNDEWPN